MPGADVLRLDVRRTYQTATTSPCRKRGPLRTLQPPGYPDFVFAAEDASNGKRLVALETKGDQLSGNLDTEYKRKVLSALTDGFSWEASVPAGQLQLVNDDGSVVECALVLIDDVDARLPALIAP